MPDTILDTLTDYLSSMLDWPAKWNGYDALPLNPLAIAHAKTWMVDTYKAHPTLSPPNITGDCDGSVVLEWWHKERKLTMYILPATIEYVQVWSDDIYGEITDGEISTADDFEVLRRWLFERDEDKTDGS